MKYGLRRFLLVIALCSVAVSCGGGGSGDEDPEGYKRVVSAHGSFTYLVPDSWSKTGFNCWQGEEGKIIEQIYPPAEIDEAYCSSFGVAEGENQEITVVEKRLYNNGSMDGCIIAWDMLNTELDREWRHCGFCFETERGIQEVSLIIERSQLDQEMVMRVINSVELTEE